MIHRKYDDRACGRKDKDKWYCRNTHAVHEKRLSVDHELFKHALRELNKLGSNINQIARALNTYGVERGMDTNFAALAEVRSAIALMRGALRGKDGDGHPQG